MKSVKSLGAMLLFGCMIAGPASASSIIELGETPPESVSSIIMLGDPDPCANNGCPEQDTASAEPGADSNAALVDIYGMPTNMPVIMRPSMDTSPTAASDTAAAAPAPAPSTEPQQPKQEPEPVVEQPKHEPAPVAQQPVAEQPTQQPTSPNGQTKME